MDLVGGFSPYPSEKYEFVNWDDDIANTVYGKIGMMTLPIVVIVIQ